MAAIARSTAAQPRGKKFGYPVTVTYRINVEGQ